MSFRHVILIAFPLQ